MSNISLKLKGICETYPEKDCAAPVWFVWTQWMLSDESRVFHKHTKLIIMPIKLMRHVLFEISLIVFYSWTTWILDLDHLVRTNGTWSYKDLTDLPSNTFLNSSERRAFDPNGWCHRFNTHWGNILLLDFICFHVVKSLMPILSLLPISAILWYSDTSHPLSVSHHLTLHHTHNEHSSTCFHRGNSPCHFLKWNFLFFAFGWYFYCFLYNSRMPSYTLTENNFHCCLNCLERNM